MKRSSKYIVVLLFLMIGLGGCYSDYPPPVLDFEGEFVVSDSNFSMAGNYSLECNFRHNISNITLGFYNKKKQLIDEIKINKTLSPRECGYGGDYFRVNYSSETTPKYIVLSSPDLWREDISINHSSYVKKGDYFYPYTPSSPNMLFPKGEVESQGAIKINNTNSGGYSNEQMPDP